MYIHPQLQKGLDSIIYKLVWFKPGFLMQVKYFRFSQNTLDTFSAIIRNRPIWYKLGVLLQIKCV